METDVAVSPKASIALIKFRMATYYTIFCSHAPNFLESFHLDATKTHILTLTFSLLFHQSPFRANDVEKLYFLSSFLLNTVGSDGQVLIPELSQNMPIPLVHGNVSSPDMYI